MIKDSVTKQEVVDLLNDALSKDPKAMGELFTLRVICNKALAEHPSIQVRSGTMFPPTVSILGILNGLFGTDENDWGCISMTTKDVGSAEVTRFELRA